MSISLYSGPLNPVNDHFVDKARSFADEHLKPNAEQWEQARQQPEKTLRTAISQFAGIRIPEELGGHGESMATLARVYEELAKVDIGFTCALAVHNIVMIEASLIGNTSLRDRYLDKLMSGEAIGAFLLTEPNTGSDATSIQTLATEKNNKYIINGSKAWVTNGVNADLLAVFAQTVPGSSAKGIAGFVIRPDMPGVSAEPAYHMLGNHAMGVNEFKFSNCAAEAELMAFAPGAGFKAAMYGINVARFGVAAMCNGALEGGLNTAVDYAKKREAFGRPIIRHQGLQWQLAEAATQLEASRMLTYRAAEIIDKGEDVTAMAAHAKKFATRAAFEGLSTAMQVMGANGLLRENPLARQMSGARVTYYMDGTTEIQNVVIGRSLLE
ncbi:MAG: acyl-CoA dehydrogenase family protein [Desulfobacterales bacterium]|jgi:alkylation response protein AidB-like acyl-CoA dehydrogenase